MAIEMSKFMSENVQEQKIMILYNINQRSGVWQLLIK